MKPITENLSEETRALQNEAKSRVRDFDRFTSDQLKPIHEIAEKYLTAREQQNYAVSDVLREELNSMGVITENLTRAVYETSGLPISVFRESSQRRKRRLSEG